MNWVSPAREVPQAIRCKFSIKTKTVSNINLEEQSLDYCGPEAYIFWNIQNILYKSYVNIKNCIHDTPVLSQVDKSINQS